MGKHWGHSNKFLSINIGIEIIFYNCGMPTLGGNKYALPGYLRRMQEGHNNLGQHCWLDI